MTGPTITTARSESAKAGGIPHLPHSHRRPSAPVSAPALTRHFLFRIPEAINPRWVDDNDKRSALWALLLTRINFAINGLAGRLGGRIEKRLWIKAISAKPGPADLIASESNSIEVVFPGEANARIRIRTAVFLECFSISVICDDIKPEHPLSERINKAIHSQDPDAMIFKLYEDKFLLIRDNLSRSLSADMGELILNDLYVVNNDEASIIIRIANKYPYASTAQPLMSTPYASFSGLVMHVDLFDRTVDRSKFDQWKSNGPKLSSGILTALSSNFSILEAFLSGGWQDYKPHLDDDQPKPTRAPDGILCGMLGGHALYASALAMTSDARNQVNYMLLYDRKFQDQLGRLIHRLHILGELRLCALMDYDAEGRWGSNGTCQEGEPANLNQAGQIIHKIDKDITEFRRISSASEEQTRYKYRPKAINYEKAVVEFSERFNKLDLCAVGGLNFRIERSRYYATSFRNQVGDLRVERIEGWQPYDEFVRRYLFQIFDGIQSIGRRYEALGRKIDRLRADTEVRQIAKQGEQTAKRTKETASLLRTAEYVGYIAANYYGFSVLYKVPAPFEIWHDFAVWMSITFLIVTLICWYWALFCPADTTE